LKDFSQIIIDLFRTIAEILFCEFIEGSELTNGFDVPAKLRVDDYQILFMLNTKPGMTSLQSIASLAPEAIEAT
jgi:hypothetical protein